MCCYKLYLNLKIVINQKIKRTSIICEYSLYMSRSIKHSCLWRNDGVAMTMTVAFDDETHPGGTANPGNTYQR